MTLINIISHHCTMFSFTYPFFMIFNFITIVIITVVDDALCDLH